MLTLHAAAKLLAHADSTSRLRPLARALGFPDPPHRTSADARRLIGLDALVEHADIARGPGALRLLCATLAPHTGLSTTTHTRELVRRLGVALLRNAPTRRWCILAIDVARTSVNIATVTPHSAGPRIAILRVDRTHVVDSDAETLRALAAVTDADDALRHARFTDILKRDALSNRFYHELQRTVTALATTATGAASRTERRELALLCASRCLFLAFLEAKGWLNGDRDFLLTHATTVLERGKSLHQQLLRPLFFGTLNTPRTHRAPAARSFGEIPFLNGGLFAPTALERKRHTLRFADDAVAALIGDLIDRYRFTAHEDSAAWSEAAVDPEMLGRAFECLMAPEERRRSGSFYTPPTLVDEVVREALDATLPDLPPHAISDEHSPLELDPQTREKLRTLRILDPACGSGAFLVHTLERIANLLHRAGDERPLHQLRRDTLTRSIFGVDRNPMAVWLCELRLWLSVVIECPETRAARVPPLPNLDHHIRVGDSLAGGDFRFAPHAPHKLAALRDRYSRASGLRKRTLATALDHEERARAIAESTQRLGAITRQRATLVASLRTKDLFGQRRTRTAHDTRQLLELRSRSRDVARQRLALSLGNALPFRFAAHFADVASIGGFDLVIGNPPWVRPHALPLTERQRLRSEFRTMHDAAWTAGAKRAGASSGFAAQADLAAAFIERGTQLLAPSGTLALLVPAKLWRALAGGGTRRFLAQHTRIVTVHDWSDAPPLFDAATYPSLLVAQRLASHSSDIQHSTAVDVDSRTSPSELTQLTTLQATNHRATPQPQYASTHRIHIAVSKRTRTHRFTTPAHQLTLAADPAAPWVLLPHHARLAFERLRLAGPALGDAGIGRPTLGVKCGFNKAFLVRAAEHDDDTASITADTRTTDTRTADTRTADARTALIERLLLRPVLRGDGIHTHTHARADVTDDLRIIWTHDATGTPLRTLPPAATRWLTHWRRTLESRRDARSRTPWWSLFRTEAARHETPRLVWADIGKQLRTRILLAGDPTVPLNSCYVLRTPAVDDAWALSALLASPVCQAWLDCLAEPARGGFRRYLGWTVASLPLPPNWLATRAPLAALGRRLHDSRIGTHDGPPHVSAEELVDAAADAYGVPVSSLQPLLDWNSPERDP